MFDPQAYISVSMQLDQGLALVVEFGTAHMGTLSLDELCVRWRCRWVVLALHTDRTHDKGSHQPTVNKRRLLQLIGDAGKWSCSPQRNHVKRSASLHPPICQDALDLISSFETCFRQHSTPTETLLLACLVFDGMTAAGTMRWHCSCSFSRCGDLSLRK